MRDARLGAEDHSGVIRIARITPESAFGYAPRGSRVGGIHGAARMPLVEAARIEPA